MWIHTECTPELSSQGVGRSYLSIPIHVPLVRLLFEVLKAQYLSFCMHKLGKLPEHYRTSLDGEAERCGLGGEAISVLRSCHLRLQVLRDGLRK